MLCIKCVPEIDRLLVGNVFYAISLGTNSLDVVKIWFYYSSALINSFWTAGRLVERPNLNIYDSMTVRVMNATD